MLALADLWDYIADHGHSPCGIINEVGNYFSVFYGPMQQRFWDDYTVPYWYSVDLGLFKMPRAD